MADWQQIAGGITAPRGFQAAGIAAGLKPSGDPDLALILSDTNAVAGGVFTTSQIKAACVTFDQHQLAQNPDSIRAIVVNAGQANACTGSQGEANNTALAQAVATAVHVQLSQVLTASTGVIGKQLDMAKLEAGLPTVAAQLSANGGDAAARAILTTDLVKKSIALEAEIQGHPVRIGGIAKGSGMIHPNLATMLGFITCDATISAQLWQTMIHRAADVSFNQITVDGDTSTNDLLIGLANGQSQAPPIQPDTPEALILEDMLHDACIYLAKAIARDGEGANKLIEIRVNGTARDEDARKMARIIASSPLVKSAAFGCDPNWGRVAAAAGRADIPFDQTALDITLGEFQLMQGGMPLAFDRQAASEYLKGDPIVFTVDLHQGFGEGKAWGCDLSYDYVRINAEYTT